MSPSIHSILDSGAHVGERLDDFGPATAPPLDDVLGAHAAAPLDRLFLEGVEVGGGAPPLDPVASGDGIGGQFLEVGEVGDGVAHRPRLGGSDHVPDLDRDPLQGLIQELLLGYQVGEDVAHPAMVVAIRKLFPGETTSHQGLSACSSVIGSGSSKVSGVLTRSLRWSISCRSRPNCRRSNTKAMRSVSRESLVADLGTVRARLSRSRPRPRCRRTPGSTPPIRRRSGPATRRRISLPPA